jgi:hypothetical protein
MGTALPIRCRMENLCSKTHNQAMHSQCNGRSLALGGDYRGIGLDIESIGRFRRSVIR